MEAEILQRLYDSEINFAIIAPIWDGGITFKLMTPAGEYIEFDSYIVKKGLEWLIKNMLELYPTSDFAKWWNQQNHDWICPACGGKKGYMCTTFKCYSCTEEIVLKDELIKQNKEVKENE